MDALNRHLRSETGVECARIVERVKSGGDASDVESGYDMSGITMSSVTGGMVELSSSSMEPEEQKPKRRQTGSGGGGGTDIWSGVTL